MNINISKPLLDAIKEFLRIALISALPLLIVQLESGESSWQSILMIVVIALLKAADEFLHEKGKLEDNENLTKGLTRF